MGSNLTVERSTRKVPTQTIVTPSIRQTGAARGRNNSIEVRGLNPGNEGSRNGSGYLANNASQGHSSCHNGHHHPEE